MWCDKLACILSKVWVCLRCSAVVERKYEVDIIIWYANFYEIAILYLVETFPNVNSDTQRDNKVKDVILWCCFLSGWIVKVGWNTQSVSSEIQVRSETNFIMLSWDLIAMVTFVLTFAKALCFIIRHLHILISSYNPSIPYNFYVYFIILTILNLENTSELFVFYVFSRIYFSATRQSKKIIRLLIWK